MPSRSLAAFWPRQLNADLHLLDWLDTAGFDYDVITDDELHHEGVELLAPYPVVLTGTHPEYWTAQMLKGMEAYQADGGRLMYLGGNGFYWITSFDPQRPHSRDEPSESHSESLRAAVVGGVGLAAVLIVMLAYWGESGAERARLPENAKDDTGPGPDRQIAVLNGKLQLTVHDVPVLGSPDADSIIVILYDYCCPHCRKTHEYLVEGLERYDGQYGLVLLPMPLDEDCNRSVLQGETGDRFEEACDLARLALAVWRADPAAFPDYDAWLYETEMPRSADEARAQAESIVGKDALDEALTDEWIDKRIADDVDAYIESPAQTIPILLIPGIDGFEGRFESAEELFEILERELKLSGSID